MSSLITCSGDIWPTDNVQPAKRVIMLLPTKQSDAAIILKQKDMRPAHHNLVAD